MCVRERGERERVCVCVRERESEIEREGGTDRYKGNSKLGPIDLDLDSISYKVDLPDH